MILHEHNNVILQDDGSEGIYIIVRDLNTNIIQTLAIMPEEVAAIHEVTNRWLMAHPQHNV